jgi:hypothetical protein
MNSWHKGHPSDRRKTTIDTGLFLSKSSIFISSELTVNIDLFFMAWRMFKFLAWSDGFPEKTEHPQSMSSAVKDERPVFTKHDGFGSDGCPIFDAAEWAVENARALFVVALKARSKSEVGDILILLR